MENKPEAMSPSQMAKAILPAPTKPTRTFFRSPPDVLWDDSTLSKDMFFSLVVSSNDE